MSDINSLENRITAALDRISRGLDARPQNGGGDVEALQAALENERRNNAELTERVRLLKERQDGQVAALSDRVETQRSQLGALDAQLQTLRASNEQLREMNARLRETVTAGLAPDLQEAAIAVEVRAMEAQRAADIAEMDAIIAELKPLIAEA
ncbi:hypothetical protein [Yoonia litorea]|uniref:Uncharacterized protein n=1 Tax=Yoonia litorea TaxID=1123755 RepID=A0A1I6MBD3_9RHOB|nr:hypothetical protein [Yoonia litorea]SFS12902.1 hypothetical protein SAMN05444714_1473 [Yoonia litorea]